MDPFTTSIVVILGKYALDKGTDLLAKEIGPKALETAKEMFGMVLERVKKVDPRTAQKYPESPDGYKAPMADALEETIQADPDFAAQLKELLTKYEAAAQEHAGVAGTSYQATVTGSGVAFAQGPGATAASGGGIAVSGGVKGGIHISGQQADEIESEKE